MILPAELFNLLSLFTNRLSYFMVYFQVHFYTTLNDLLHKIMVAEFFFFSLNA